MRKIGKTVSVLVLTTAAYGGSGCSSKDWFVHDHKTTETPPTPSPIGSSVSPPVNLQQLIVADTPPPAISGGTLVVNASGTVAVAADSDRDTVYVIDILAQTSTPVSLSKGCEPGRAVLDGNGGAHVALRGKGSVVRIDLATATVVAETSACQLPRGLAYDAKSNELLVACASGELVTLDASSHSEHQRVSLEHDLRDVMIASNGQRLVSKYRSAELITVNGDGSIAQRATPLNTVTQRFDDLSDGGISGATSSGGPLGNGGLTPREVTSSPTLAWRTVLSATGGAVMLHQQSQNDEVIISEAGGYGGGGSCQTITQGGITVYDQNGRPTAPILLTGAALAVDIAVSADAKWVAVAKPGAFLRGEQASLEVLPTSGTFGSPVFLGDAGFGGFTDIFGDAGVVTQPSSLDAGVPSDGGAVSPAMQCTSGWTDGFQVQTTAVAFDAQGNLYTFSREPAQLTVYDNLTVGDDVFVSFPQLVQNFTLSLSTKSMRDTGHELFHADVGSGLSCASCHGEALDDGHVWNFRGFGPRRTQNMRGGFLDTLPLHWEGDLTTFQHLVDEVMTRRMGGFTVEERYATALANWINKQPTLRLAGGDSAAIARGQALFESAEAQCATCHTGATLTNNQTVDVGTGGAFQVPSLRGVGMHPPYMHDGCAPTLNDRFNPKCGGGDKHGKTSHLSGAQISDLVAYLQSL